MGITGAGNHSKGGFAEIRPAVDRFLIDKGFEYELDPFNMGALRVKMAGEADLARERCVWSPQAYQKCEEARKEKEGVRADESVKAEDENLASTPEENGKDADEKSKQDKKE